MRSFGVRYPESTYSPRRGRMTLVHYVSPDYCKSVPLAQGGHGGDLTMSVRRSASRQSSRTQVSLGEGTILLEVTHWL